ncbi:MAG TPA: hypothetical protein VMS17_28485, partial [Gemmataceae bacterium]|nr:hypothetical protein [Gemmataceae bacterium]
MTGAENPESILPAVTAPPPAPTPLPAPTPSPPTQTERPRRRRSWITETVLAVLVVAFAFLAASFVARNADIWLHMATGRLLAHGQYNPFGRTDPFAYTTAHVPWINHAWLFDWIVYLLYREKADAWLVVGKAALIAVLAGLMLLIRRPGKPGWIPAFCTALAVLAMSPQLLLQPRCVSVMLVGVTFWLLWRCRAPADPSAKKPRLPVDARALLIPLCILWVNLDDWFLLGPLLVGLFWIGDLMRPAAPSPPTPLPRSGG